MARATWAPLPTSFWISTKASNMGSPPAWPGRMMGRAATRHKLPTVEFTQSLPSHQARTLAPGRRIDRRGSDHSLERAASPGHNRSSSPAEEGSALHPARNLPIAFVTALVLLAVAASSTAEAGGPPTASLVASPPVITVGDMVQLSGSVGEDPS